MPKLTIGQKTHRLLRFLTGARDPSISQHLGPFGFSQQTLDEGWALLREVSGARLATRPLGSLNAGLIDSLDRWENLWFPIAAAVLGRHHPAVHERVFLNLTQTQGTEVLVSVGTFLDRLDALAHTGEADTGEEGAAALATLAAHGLTQDVLGEARTLLHEVTSVAAPSAELDEEELARLEDTMWGYYLQWSTIVRSVIKDRRMLRRLGFLQARPDRAPGDDELPLDDGLDLDDDLPLDDELDAAPDDDFPAPADIEQPRLDTPR